MPTLEELAHKSSIIIDISFLGRSDDPNVIIERLKEFNKFLNNTENVITVPGVVKEFEGSPRSSKEGSDKLKVYVNRGTNPDVKEKYHRISSKTAFLKRTAKKLRKREVDFSPSTLYQSFLKTLYYLADTLKIKEPDKRTDESIVATAFTLAHSSPQEIIILSNDHHIFQLSCALIRELLIPTIDNYVKEAIEISKNRGIRIYKRTKDYNCELKWDSRNYNPGRPRLRNYKQQENLKNILEYLPVLA